MGMRAARIYRLAELIGGKINHLQVQACHGPAQGCLLGWGRRCPPFAAEPRLGRAGGGGDRGKLRRSPSVCPEQEGRYLGRRPAVNRCWREEFRTQSARDGVLFRIADTKRAKEICPPAANGCTKIKHDGFRIIARKNGAQVRPYSRPANGGEASEDLS